jgi:uncharacterized cupredoxin-like copper-binding protein
MPTLDEIRKEAKPLVDVVTKKLISNAPRKTGNLQRALKRANTLDTMLDVPKAFTKTEAKGQLTFTIDYAPTGAEYGKFWNSPTISKSVKNAKTKNKNKIDFAEKTLDDKDVDRALNQLVDMITANLIESLGQQIDEALA